MVENLCLNIVSFSTLKFFERSCSRGRSRFMATGSEKTLLQSTTGRDHGGITTQNAVSLLWIQQAVRKNETLIDKSWTRWRTHSPVDRADICTV